jgi:hypothetical protein
MKFIIQTASVLLLCLLTEFFLPWWIVAPVCFVIAFVFDSRGMASFLAGFLGVGLLWLGMAFWSDWSTGSILTSKVNELFPVNVFILTVLVGGVTGGLASLTGSLARRVNRMA